MSRAIFKIIANLSLSLIVCGSVNAQISDKVIKIGFITDMSSAYADIDGKGGVEAIKLAIADAALSLKGVRVELLTADHQHKADIASSKAREWFDREGLDVLISGTNSATTLAMAQVAVEKKKPFIAVGGGTTRLANEECSPYTIQYAYDTAAVARTTASAVVALGGKTWYFLAADYAYGASLQKETSDIVVARGGTVLGSVKHPLSASDFSSFLLQAQASKAQVLGFANAGADLIASIKGAKDFGLTKTMMLAAPLMFETDINALGLAATQGMYTSSAWYWDADENTRAWAKRFFAVVKRQPTFLHAADYSAVRFYIQSVLAAGTDDGDKVMEKMKSTRVNDMFAKDAYIRPDGRLNKDMFLLQVKKPDESKYPWDFFKIVKKLPGEQVLIKKSESKCQYWK
ncbi:amino acid/amide ABC transporter substrate-binding protein, HAAT family [Polaromonas sp. OV174]|uniref:ABC transporter substrate-binding protein n=1 Tax=Polaromonas sp. OV174 TaxID=1855300 RepID=UPI0008EB5123|nr:ABC transporter substrate-binding protein [Polaromonas sp. OV174]SFC52353.1 amino acid/amide ABC transporter substrate-binding protein, HAAT family [Polaromonas sp. OV174]